MSTGLAMPLERADRIVSRFIELFGPYCERIAVAGSVRRRKAKIGDIDMLAIPKATRDLLGQTFGDELADALNEAVAKGTIAKGDQWGDRKKKIILLDGTAIDLVSCEEDNWGSWLLIRTGPAEFNKAIVTNRGKGGLLPDGWRFGESFRLFDADGNKLPTRDEREVFAALGLEWIEPERRRIPMPSTTGGKVVEC